MYVFLGTYDRSIREPGSAVYKVTDEIKVSSPIYSIGFRTVNEFLSYSLPNESSGSGGSITGMQISQSENRCLKNYDSFIWNN